MHPGDDIYEGMIIGVANKGYDLVVNAMRSKRHSSMRSAGADEALNLVPPSEMTLEFALEFIEDNELSGVIHILGLLPRLDQIQLMRAAAAIVQPSLFEGWSTVVEDVRALGKRVFLSDIPVHREQQPPGAIYFQPDAPNTLAKGIAEVWDTLPGGPCSSEEEDALGTQRTRVAQYGRDFLAIVRELLGETTT